MSVPLRSSLLRSLATVLALLAMAVPEARATHRTLPPWDDSMSDGCSFSPDVNDGVRAACTIHDKAYYYGGSEQDRLAADDKFREDLVRADMWRWVASIYYRGVRTFGGPGLRLKGVSWSFGGEYFAYDDHPAVPSPPAPSG